MKKYKYTVLSLLFAVLFILGSMAAANGILRHRETQLLTEKGGIKVEAPVREWADGGNTDETAGGNALSMEQIEDAAESWNSRIGVILHERVAGQISMEEAIENGKKWLAELEIGDGKEETPSFSISAELGVGWQRKDIGEQEAYFSFWTVTYSNQSMNASLYLNAVTGNVWGAEIRWYEEQPMKASDDRLRLFVKLAGLQAGEEVPPMDSGEIQSAITIEGSQLYAQEVSYDMADQFEKGYEYLAYQLLKK